MTATRDQLNAFLASVERRALRMAEYTLADRDAALDVVQDAMLRLVVHYADKPPQQWRPLFYRIFENRLRDAQRHDRRWRPVLRRFGSPGPNSDADGNERDTGWQEEAQAADNAASPEQQAQDVQSLAALLQALKQLPPRQQQAFRLRIWDGLGVRDTALAMGVSPGSVKTHLSRAMATLRQALEDFAA